ncbi:MAG TPA: hypothetical protein IAC25_03470 [Candidatus Enterenecus stercoripullorum]|nr:hypothetical protein [Candidatus Enterenecus stercoripullorum]
MKSTNKAKMKAVLPAVGVSMAAGAALLMMVRPKKKHNIQKAAGKAIRAVGEAVENFPGGLKM